MTLYGISACAQRQMMLASLPVVALAIIIIGQSPAMASDVEVQGSYPSFLSRITIELPLFTRHAPHDGWFNDHNQGALAEFALGPHFAITAGNFMNSYNRNTTIAGVSWLPLNFEFSHLRIDVGGIVAADLNGGYKRVNTMHPFLGAFEIKLMGGGFDDTRFETLNRVGLGITIVPPSPKNGSTAINLGLRYRLGG